MLPRKHRPPTLTPLRETVLSYGFTIRLMPSASAGFLASITLLEVLIIMIDERP